MSYENYIEKIDEYLKAHREQIVQELSELVKIPSVTSDRAACKRVLEATRSLFAKRGVELDVKEHYAIGSYGSCGGSIGLYAHADVVAAEGEWVTGNAFEPKYQNGCLIGRGSEDNKSGIMASLYALSAIQELNIPLKNKLTFFVGTSEETGMADMESYLANEALPDLSLVPDGDFPLYSGEKGIMRFMLKSKKKLEHIRKFKGGSCYNIVLERADAEIDYSEALYEQIKDKIDERFTLSHDTKTIFLSAKGKAKHAAYPEGSQNAAALLAGVLYRCFSASDLSWDRHILRDIASLTGEYYGESFEIEHTDSVFGRLTCSNGIVDIEDGALKASFDIRYGTEFDSQAGVKKIFEVVNHLWEVEELSVDNGYNFTSYDRGVKAVLDAYRRVSGVSDAVDEKSSGGTYARHLKNAYPVGTTVPYIKGGLDLPEGHGGIHQPDEYLNLDSFIEATKITTAMLLALDNAL